MISDKVSRLGFADEKYYVASVYLLQHSELRGEKIEFKFVELFDRVFACLNSQSWLPE
jgi:hypothetical protein